MEQKVKKAGKRGNSGSRERSSQKSPGGEILGPGRPGGIPRREQIWSRKQPLKPSRKKVSGKEILTCGGSSLRQ